MRERLIEMLSQFLWSDNTKCDNSCKGDEECADCLSEHIADYLLANGVTIPPTICEHCTFYEPFEKVEDFDGRCCLMNGAEVDRDFYCKWGAKK